MPQNDDEVTVDSTFRSVDVSAAVADGRNEQDITHGRFEADTVAAAASVRTALGALVADIPGSIRRPRELQRALGVDYKICWQVINVIQASDPLTAATHTPTESALKRFLASGLEIGVNRSRVEAVRTAVKHFSRVVRTHADDPSTFRSMVAAVASDEGDAATDVQHRRAAYRSLSHIWGVQTDAHLAAGFVRRNDDPGDGLHECLLTMKMGFRRLRSDVLPIVYGSRDSSNQPQTEPTRRLSASRARLRNKPFAVQVPLDPEAAVRFHAPLLPRYSSTPLPELRTVSGGGGWLYTKLATQGIGRQAKVDLTFGVSFPHTPITLDTDRRELVRGGITFRTPTGLLVFDLIVHRPSFGGDLDVHPLAFLDVPGSDDPLVAREAPQLRPRDKVIALGRADRALSVPEWPRYPEILRFAADRLDWELSEFDVYRLRIEYPVLGSVARLQFHPPMNR